VGVHRHGVHRSYKPCRRKQGFNKPVSMRRAPELAQRNVYASSFIFGMTTNRRCAERTLKEIRTWPQDCHFGLLTPLPRRRFTKGWRRRAPDVRSTARVHPFEMAQHAAEDDHAEAHAEVKAGGLPHTARSHGSSCRFVKDKRWLSDKHFHRSACVSGNLFPQMGLCRG